MTEPTQEQIDAVAAALWKAQAIDAGAPPSVAERRTLDSFKSNMWRVDQDTWRKQARAAIAAMPAPEVTVQDERQFRADERATVIAEIERDILPAISEIADAVWDKRCGDSAVIACSVASDGLAEIEGFVAALHTTASRALSEGGE